MASSASDPVEEGLSQVEAALQAQHTDYLEALRAEVIAPLHAQLAESTPAHETEMAALRDASTDRKALWQAVRTYRRRTARQVWRPLRTLFSNGELGHIFDEQRTAVAEARAAVGADLPETVSRPEPSALFEAASGDGPWRRLRKVLVRGRRGLQSNGTPPEQVVPLAGLVRRVAATRLAGAQAEACAAAEQAVAQWAARLEREAVAWTHRLLEIERQLDHPQFHEPDQVDGPSVEAPEGELDRQALRDDLRARADDLQTCLAAGQALSLDAAAEEFKSATAQALRMLRREAARAGTFLARVEPMGKGEEETPERAARWADWFGEVGARLALLDTLGEVRDAVTTRQATLTADAMEAGLAPVRTAREEAIERLQAVRETLDDLLQPPEPGGELDLVQAVDHQVEVGIGAVEEALLEPLRNGTPRRATQAVVDAHTEAVRSAAAEQPEGFVMHPPVAPDATVHPTADAEALPWREVVHDTFDTLLFEAWTAAVTPLADRAAAVLERGTEAHAILQFHLRSALQDVQDLRAARQRGDGDGTFIEDARELALGGIDRALEVLAEEEGEMAASGARVREDIWTATARAWTELHDRVRAAGEARAHVLRLQGQLVRGSRWLARDVETQSRGIATQAARAFHRVRRQATRLLRMGQAAVGTEPVDEAALRQTMDALSSVDAVLARLPLVYRRLFSFRPVQDPSFLVGREADRQAVEQHLERWRRGLTSALVVTGAPGSGHTSLLNVLRSTTFRDTQHHHLELTERVPDVTAFARQVAQALDLPRPAGRSWSLDAVAEALDETASDGRPRVCTIEHLEHVLHRTVGGTGLSARILHFLAATDPYVLWIGSMSTAAWQRLEASEPAATRLVSRHALTSLSQEALESLIRQRHQRSGLPLQFEPPTEAAAPILARRLRAADEARQQELLRAEYFEQLHEASGQNIMLALFYWVRSVEVEPEAARLRVRPLDAISFAGLEALPLPHAFLLKAFLEHRTLTVAEAAAILRAPPEVCHALFEALGNALVLVPAAEDEGASAFAFGSVDRGARYRIRPLLVHPVTRVLRARNIVHGPAA